MWRVAKHIHMRSCRGHTSFNTDHGLPPTRFENCMVGKAHIEMCLQSLKYIAQNEAHVPMQIPSRVNFPLLFQPCKFSVVTGAHKRHLSDCLARCSLLLYAQGRN